MLRHLGLDHDPDPDPKMTGSEGGQKLELAFDFGA